MFGILVQVFGKILTSNWFRIFSGIVVVLVGLYFLHSIYNLGYEKGYNDLNTIVLQERIEWQEKIAKLQKTHESTVQEIEKNYDDKIKELNENIEKLEKNLTDLDKVLEDGNNPIPNSIVALHDRIIKGEPLNKPLTQKESQGIFTVNDLIKKLNKNYNLYKKCDLKLQTIQGIVKDFQKQQQEIMKEK